ncbi:DedA family protein [Helicobacter sp. 13S00477-4]|uniref:DedA family protein n=1 Tax=Helicobacter sp. 13S00477-4 TaxID=1905759 RepID=UPI002150E615|nr:DedA family protein [Helicobacter sp. 13S00477-4]
MSEIIDFIVKIVGNLGYFGIFLMMFLESSFFPFPSEIAMIPAGYLAYKGEINIYIAIIIGTLGSVAGAFFNYYIALKLGRRFILQYGRYLFFTESSMKKMESFFKKHGEISTFLGRLIPGVRQYISLPAGIAKMNLYKFCLYTAIGAGIWIMILTFFGYYLGVWLGNEINIKEIIQTFNTSSLNSVEINIKSYLHYIILTMLGIVIFIALIYILYRKKRK